MVRENIDTPSMLSFGSYVREYRLPFTNRKMVIAFKIPHKHHIFELNDYCEANRIQGLGHLTDYQYWTAMHVIFIWEDDFEMILFGLEHIQAKIHYWSYLNEGPPRR